MDIFMRMNAGQLQFQINESGIKFYSGNSGNDKARIKNHIQKERSLTFPNF